MEITVLRRVLERNDRAAVENRAVLDAQGVTCINLLGGAGSGKTALLEAMLPKLAEGRRSSDGLRCAVLEGDLATTRDAERIAAMGVPVIQLLTEGGCHLTASHVQAGLSRLPLSDADLLVIENVGNPICPANFDLGEHFRIAVLSVAEGGDKPAKYPLLFKDAAAVVISKIDLLSSTDVDLRELRRDLARINPSVDVFLTSARKDEGVERLAEWVREQIAARKPIAAVLP